MRTKRSKLNPTDCGVSKASRSSKEKKRRRNGMEQINASPKAAVREASVAEMYGITPETEVFGADNCAASYNREIWHSALDGTTGRGVFVVHGHDEGAKESVASFLEKLDLKPVILEKEPDNGCQTIIEKFERYASKVVSAVVLLTPDDEGARPRPNVWLELGYLLHLLGRNQVWMLKSEVVKMPSDLHGVLYIELDQKGGWRLKLAQEMKRAGLEVGLDLANSL
jgi:predicted nucleotide-binding protein